MGRTGRIEIYIWDYTTDYVHSLVPMINMPVVTANMKFYMEHGAKGIMLEGDSMGWGRRTQFHARLGLDQADVES